MFPLVQLVNPGTVTVMLPKRLPEERFSKVGATVPLPLKMTVPPLMDIGLLVMKELPLKSIVPLVKVFVPSTWKRPLLVIVPLVTVKLPVPSMLAVGESTAMPLTLRVIPVGNAKEPLLSPSVSARVPLFTCTEPALLQRTLTVVVPVPELLRSVPEFSNAGIHELRMSAFPSA
jgi:hypothetical protein